jgi:hypothetical protein
MLGDGCVVLGTLFADPSSHDTGMQPFLCLFLSYLYALFAESSAHDTGTEFVPESKIELHCYDCSWSSEARKKQTNVLTPDTAKHNITSQNNIWAWQENKITKSRQHKAQTLE